LCCITVLVISVLLTTLPVTVLSSFAPENPEDGEMYLVVPAYPGCPG